MKIPLSRLRWVAIAPLSAAIALSHSMAARADDLALSFELAPRTPKPTAQALVQIPIQKSGQNSVHAAASAQVEPLGIPAQAASVPTGASDDAAMTVPPPPPQPEPAAVSPTPQVEAIPAEQPTKPAELSFDMPLVDAASQEVAASPIDIPAEQSPRANHSPNLSTRDGEARLFEGGSDSLVARAVGSAEGTRTPDGQRNPAYYGHVDPGNGVWNLGSFSYQHGASSPEEADVRQLARLRQQAQVLEQKAIARNLNLTLEERLNGIDLANQAPAAALGKGGYVDWLDQAHQMGMRGSDAVLWARTRSFLDPDTSRWDAPGLGNNLYRISSDQERRLLAIAKAIEADRRRPEPVQPSESGQAETASQPLPENAEEEAIARLFEQEVPPAFAPAPEPTATANPNVAVPASETSEPLAVGAILSLDLSEGGDR